MTATETMKITKEMQEGAISVAQCYARWKSASDIWSSHRVECGSAIVRGNLEAASKAYTQTRSSLLKETLEANPTPITSGGFAKRTQPKDWVESWLNTYVLTCAESQQLPIPENKQYFDGRAISL
jgi:hypothetical protein